MKQLLKDDPVWATFLQLASQSKRKIQQTSLAALAPPNQRSKARYMNVDLLIDWGCKILTFFDKQIDSQTLFKPKEVEAKLGWILTYRESLAQWQVLVELVTTTESFVRTQGISSDSQTKLSNLLTKQIISERVSWLRRELLKFVAQEASKCKPNERLVGSSEVLESVFGKLKYLEGDQAGSGFTALVLCLAAILSKTTNQTVKTALESVSAEQVRVWQKKNLGQSIQAKRKQALINSDKKSSQNKANNMAGANNHQTIFDKKLSSTTLLTQTAEEILVGKRQ